MSEKTPLTPERFDRIIWTAKRIAERAGTGPDFVRDTLVNMPGSPVKKIGGRYCAVERELLEFFGLPPV